MRQMLSRAAHVRDLHDSLEEIRQNPPLLAEQVPPSSNTGGNPPSLNPSAPLLRVKIDWLAFTSTAGFRPMEEVLKCLFPAVFIQHNEGGMLGYPSSANLSLYGVHIGIFAWGADHGRDLISITGEGCREWHVQSYPFIRECLDTIEATITRIDHALDFYRGELTYEDCEAALAAGEFKLKSGGRNPSATRMSTESNGTNCGRTLYVGKGKNSAKFIRMYEKGLQLFANMSEEFKLANTDPQNVVWGDGERAPNGTIATQWLRAEVQNSNKDGRVLPLDMVTDTDSYFAGAYPFCARILGLTDGKRPDALKPVLDVELERMIMNARNAYGNLIFSLKALGFTGNDIIEMLSTGRHNERLVKSGIIGRVQNDPNWLEAMKDRIGDVPF